MGDLYLMLVSGALLLIGAGLLVARARTHFFGLETDGVIADIVERERRDGGSFTPLKYRMAVIEFYGRDGRKRRFEDGLVVFWMSVGARVRVVYDPRKKRARYVNHGLCIYLAPMTLLAMGSVALYLVLR